jgi:hypothetical protein
MPTKGLAMRTRLRAATLAGFLGVASVLTGAAVAPDAASAAAVKPAGSCCIRFGYGPWFSGPSQLADCNAYGTAQLWYWDGYHCTPGTNEHAGQTQVTFWLIIS